MLEITEDGLYIDENDIVFFRIIDNKKCIFTVDSATAMLNATFKWSSTFFGGFGIWIWPIISFVAGSVMYVKYWEHGDCCPDTSSSVQSSCGSNAIKIGTLAIVKLYRKHNEMGTRNFYEFLILK